MSNKPKRFKEKKDKVIQIGNYLVSFEKGQFRSVKITSVAGNWNVRYREDNPLFTYIVKEMESKEGQERLHLQFASYYMVCNAVPDDIFLKELITNYNASIDRVIASNQKPTNAEDAKIIEEEKEKYNLFKNSTNDTRN